MLVWNSLDIALTEYGVYPCPMDSVIFLEFLHNFCIGQISHQHQKS